MGKGHNIQSEADRRLHESDNMNNIITFNGQGCSGKTTQAKRLVKTNPENYQRIHSYKLRSAFEDKVYSHLGRKHENIRYSDGRCQKLRDVEVLGIPTLAWVTAHFHLNIKPFVLKGTTVVLDHYLGDYYADMLAGANIDDFQRFVREDLEIPDFNQGTHFYLDIDYCTHKERYRERAKKETRVSQKVFEKRRKRYQELCELGYLKRINVTMTMSKSEVDKEIQKVLDR